MSDDDERQDEPVLADTSARSAALGELTEVLGDLERLLKSGELGAALSERGINTSLALVAAEGLRAYLEGDKPRAAEDLRTVAEEIEGRLTLSRPGGNGSAPS